MSDPIRYTLALAHWPRSNLRQYWNGRDSFESIWLQFRVADHVRNDIDSYEAPARDVGNAGLWVFVSAGSSITCELRAYEVFSACPFELRQLATWLDRNNRKIDRLRAKLQPTTVLETVACACKAMGVKTGVVLDNHPRTVIEPLLATLTRPGLASVLADLEDVRLGRRAAA